MAKRTRFVQPDVMRLPLSDGDWLKVKKRLTVGEERTALAAVIGEIRPDGSRKPNMDVLGMGEVAAYIVDWSFTDQQDEKVSYTFDALKSIDSETYAEIEKAIDVHKAAMVAEADAAKKSRAGERDSSAISTSAA